MNQRVLDIDFVRAQFEVFADPDVGEWAHLENAGGSYLPRQVTDRLHRLYTKAKVQPYGGWGPSTEAGDAMDESKALVGALFNAEPGEVQLGPSTSQNTYVLAQALRAAMNAGDEVIVTDQDHEANSGVWRRLADTGIVVREWQVDPATGLLDVADLEALLTERTKLVCVTHCSNVAATINPIAAITQLVHDAGARIVVDGVAWAPHAAIDVKALDVDFYLCSLYKTFGPHLGLLYVRPDHLADMANQGHFFNADEPTYLLTPAGPQHAVVGAVAGIFHYHDAVHRHHYGQLDGSMAERVARNFELVAPHEEALMAPILDVLRDRAGVRIAGATVADRAIRAPTIAFAVEGWPSADIAAKLHEAKIGCGAGNFYAYRLVEAMGFEPNDGLVRLSMVHYNTVEETTRAAEVIDSLF